MKLWLVRHVQPLVAAGICYGRLDLPADAGTTADCAARLAALLPADCRVVSSPLQRCEQLAQALHALRPDLAYKTDVRLQEMDFGQWEGSAWQDIGQHALQAWTDDFASHAAGHDGESVSAFMARVAAAFDALSGQGDMLWVTHAGVIRAARLLSQGIRQVRHASDWPLEGPKYGQWQLLHLHAG
ncbi:MAG: Phosphoglycerate mutase [Polaromonas sp.]|nr:Phosphoglycerate mutase [Polaromonas sp.]